MPLPGALGRGDGMPLARRLARMASTAPAPLDFMRRFVDPRRGRGAAKGGGSSGA